MWMDDTVKAVLTQEGSATFVTTGSTGAHLVATWQSYILVVDERTIAFPAGGLRQTEANVRAGSPMQMVIGSKVPTGTGYRLTGTAEFETGTPMHERLKERFPWCRAAVVMHLENVEKVLG